MEFGLVALWLGVYLALLVAGSVVGTLLFPRFADRGAGVGIPLALLVVWLVTFVVGRASLAAGIWLGVAVLAGLVVLGWREGVELDGRSVAETSVVFTVAFLFWVWIRVFAVPVGASDPVIAVLPLAIGEKFLDFGLLKSLLRAETLPPVDVWFAGEPVAYYYGGHLVAAILGRITGTAGRFAYNLALSGFYAMLVTAVYGLAGNVAADRDIPRRLAAAGSALAVGVASNLSTPGNLLLWMLPDGVAAAVASRLGVERTNLANGPANFWYFDASRVISDEQSDFVFQFRGTGPSPTINEFPFFSWFNGDMHAHMMSTAFLVLAAAVCFSYYQTPAAETRRRRALLLGVLPAVAGFLAVTNTWSFPTPAGLALLTVALAPPDPRTLLPSAVARRLPANGLAGEGSRLLAGLTVAGAVVALGLLWSLPFWFGPASGREVAILPDRSSLGELIVVHGLFLAVFGTYLYGRARQLFGDEVGLEAVVVLLAALVLGLVDLAALGLFVPLVAFGWLFSRSEFVAERFEGVRSAAAERADGGRFESVVGFETVLLVAGAGLAAIVEFVYLKEPSGRMNTVFKVYMQVWVLWSVALGPALAWVLADRVSRPSTGQGSTVGLGSTVLRASLVFLFVSSALYAPLAISAAYDGDDPTVDGLAYLEREYPGEAEAIHWLDDREGRQTLVTAVPAGYNWNPSEGKGAAAPASLTGHPTVLGWFHEAQYRNDTVYDERYGDVGTIYQGERADRAALLERYDVDYVYVGPAERARYDGITVGELGGVTPVHQSGEVTIYGVEQDELPE